MDHVSEVAYWILSTVCVEAASVQQLGVRSLDAVNFFVGGSASWCFHQTHIVGSRPSCREGVPFVEVHRSLFGVDLVAEQRFVCVEVHQIGPCDAVSYFD